MAKILCWTAITAAALFTGPSTVQGFNLASLSGAERVTSLNNAFTRSRDRPRDQPLNQRSFQLRSSTKDEIDPFSSPQLDTDAVTKYLIAAATELSLFAGT
ncbi:hypothetical protein THAOC_26277, partial [Thalassiosira oceanica]